jgi:hypothetical protein
MYVCLSVKCPLLLSDFNETWISSTYFRKKRSSGIKFHENPFCGSRVVPCGQTGMAKLIVTFRSVANAPENVLPIVVKARHILAALRRCYNGLCECWLCVILYSDECLRGCVTGKSDGWNPWSSESIRRLILVGLLGVDGGGVWGVTRNVWRKRRSKPSPNTRWREVSCKRSLSYGVRIVVTIRISPRFHVLFFGPYSIQAVILGNTLGYLYT